MKISHTFVRSSIAMLAVIAIITLPLVSSAVQVPEPDECNESYTYTFSSNDHSSQNYGDDFSKPANVDFTNTSAPGEPDKITVTADAGFEITKVELSVDDDNSNGFVNYPVPVTDLNPAGTEINVAKVTVKKICANTAPTASNAATSTPENTPKQVTLVATDPELNSLTYSIVGNPSNGTLGTVTGNKVTYTPNTGYNGPDSFTFKANDGTSDSNNATISITVTPLAACEDGIDNDDDGKVDAQDPGCSTSSDDSETDPVIDVCSNIDGAQGTVPEGYTQNQDGTCSEIPPTDMCSNLEGPQATVPEGYSQNQDGTCSPVEQPIDVCSNIDGNQTTVPDGYNVDGTICTLKQCIVTSSTTTLSDGNASALLTFIHSAWATISGASWIWGTDPVADPTVDTTQVFTKTFALESVPLSASIELAADNGYTLKVNDVVVDDQIAVEANYNPTNVIPVTNLVAGNNTIEVTVKNFGVSGAPATDNPAGLIYKLTVDGSNCGEVTTPPPPPDPTTLKVHILKYLKTADGISPVAADSGAPAFPMWAQWSASNIGSGSGNYVLGPAGHGGSGAYAADTSPMTSPASYQTYEVQDGTVVLPPEQACQSGKYRFVGYQSGNSLSEALSSEPTTTYPNWGVLTADKYLIVVNEKCPDTSTVTICKYNNDGEERSSLSGWNLFLKGAHVQDLSVDSGVMSGINSNPLTAGVSYLATVAGTWTNQGGANPVDAEYSTTDGWTTHMDGYDGYGVGILELEINEADGGWGPYNSGHEYAQSFSVGSDGPANFRIFDGNTVNHAQNEGWFGDNSGSLPVSIFKGYAGVTDGDGCVVFEDVPYGSYTIGETPQDGWSNVSGLGEVTIDGPEESFEVINQEGESEEPVDVCSNIEGDQETVPEGYEQNQDGTCSLTEEEPPVTETPTSENSNVHTRSVPAIINRGQVLGASTGQVLGESCGLYMDQYLRRGSAKNNSGQVTKLQAFLNKHMGSGLPATGYFGPLTEAAVKAFQSKYSNEVLKPWGIGAPTGLAYLSTLRQINLIECPELSLTLPPLVEWSRNPSAQ